MAFSQYADVRVGLLWETPTRQVMVMGDGGPLTIWVDGKKVAELTASDGLVLKSTDAGIHAKSLMLDLTAKKSIIFRSQGGRGFRMRNMAPKTAERSYPGSLELSKANGNLKMVATVPLEEYVAGVVQAEAGKGHWLEYYKLQAVSCRTYALANLTKHAADGFELCDGTHCQVFKGAATDPTILQAAKATHGMVVVDANIRLIHATFHSNCGGETLNAEDVWSKPEPYLRSTVDTFCTKAPHAAWRRVIGRNEWLGYLQRKFDVDTTDRQRVEVLTGYSPSCRDLYLCDIDPLIPLEQVRTDWKLNSAYFSIGTEQGNVVLTGRGFGHGVGLCQEGAMNMARSGASFTDILHHYYADVHLVDLSTLDFFRDAGD